MTVRMFTVSIVIGTSALVAGGCKKEWSDRDHMSKDARERALGEPGAYPSSLPGPPGTGTTTLTGATVINNQSAIDQVVLARCAREDACKAVGPDKRVGTEDSCVQKLKTDMKTDLNVNECPRGIDQKELTECLDAIKKEDCSNPLDALSRLAACRTSELCLK